MRLAPHIDHDHFYARRPQLGHFFRLLGYVLLLLSLHAVVEQSANLFYGIVITTFAAWFAAWYTAVGAAWRSSLVSALLAQLAIYLYMAESLV